MIRERVTNPLPRPDAVERRHKIEKVIALYTEGVREHMYVAVPIEGPRDLQLKRLHADLVSRRKSKSKLTIPYSLFTFYVVLFMFYLAPVPDLDKYACGKRKSLGARAHEQCKTVSDHMPAALWVQASDCRCPSCACFVQPKWLSVMFAWSSTRLVIRFRPRLL